MGTLLLLPEASSLPGPGIDELPAAPHRSPRPLNPLLFSESLISAEEGAGKGAENLSVVAGDLRGQTRQRLGALHFYYSGCCLLSASYVPGIITLCFDLSLQAVNWKYTIPIIKW